MATRFDKDMLDDFDVWNINRARLLTEGSSSLPSSVSPSANVVGVSDLARYGEWVYVDNRPYWRPTVVVNYVPYRSGHWSYVANCGYVWDSRETLLSDPFDHFTDLGQCTGQL